MARHVVQQLLEAAFGVVELACAVVRHAAFQQPGLGQRQHVGDGLPADLAVGGADQRRQVLGVTCPLRGGAAVDGLAHLPHRGRLHRALQGIELQHAVFPADADVVQHAPGRGGGVGHHVFVLHFQDLAREQLLPGVHQQVVVGQLLADPVEVVREAHAAVFGAVVGEEVRQRDVARVAPHRDDLRVREQQLDEADVLEVVRQLVDHVARCGREVLQLLQHLAGDARQDLGRQVVDTVGVAAARAGAALPALQRRDDTRDQPQFAGTVDLAVAGQDLLHQRGARARHADHEHRHGARQAAAAVLVQLAREGVADARALLAVRHRVVAQVVAARGIGFVGECEGAVVVLALFPGGGQLEQEPGAHAAFQARRARGLLQAFQRRVVLRETAGADQRRQPPGRLQGLHLFETGDGVVDAALLHQQVAQAVQRRRQGRLQGQRRTVAGFGLLGLLLLGQHGRHGQLGLRAPGQVGGQRQRAFGSGAGGGLVVLQAGRGQAQPQRQRVLAAGFGMRDRTAQQRRRLLQVALQQRQFGPLQRQRRLSGLVLQGLAQQLLRLRVAVLRGQPLAATDHQRAPVVGGQLRALLGQPGFGRGVLVARQPDVELQAVQLLLHLLPAFGRGIGVLRGPERTRLVQAVLRLHGRIGLQVQAQQVQQHRQTRRGGGAARVQRAGFVGPALLHAAPAQARQQQAVFTRFGGFRRCGFQQRRCGVQVVQGQVHRGEVDARGQVQASRRAVQRRQRLARRLGVAQMGLRQRQQHLFGRRAAAGQAGLPKGFELLLLRPVAQQRQRLAHFRPCEVSTPAGMAVLYTLPRTSPWFGSTAQVPFQRSNP